MLPTDDEIYELIDQYIRAELSAKEVVEFEERLKTDEAFAKAYKTESNIRHVTAYDKEQELESMLNAIHQETLPHQQSDFVTEKKTATIRKIPNRNMLLAAAAVLTGLITAIYLFYPIHETPEMLAAAHFERPTFEQVRGVADFEKIKQLYNSGNYKKAIVSLKKYENLPDMALYQGICHLELNQIDQAINTFRQLQNDPDFYDEATWYLALTYLKAGNKNKGILELDKLATGKIASTPKLKANATKLLGKLK